MFDGMSYDPKEFAAAYIQTLPHAKKSEEFDNDEEFENYLNYRRSLYFNDYLSTLAFANSFSKSKDETDV